MGEGVARGSASSNERSISEMSPPVKGPFNSRASGTIARVAFKYLTTPHAPITEGGFRNLKIVCPEGTILSAPANAPMAWFNMAVVSTIDLVLRAVQPAMPEAITAGSADNIGMSHISGIDPRTGSIIETRHELKGVSFAGKVLVFPGAKGSSGWSSQFHVARLMGKAPAAMLFNEMTTKIALGAVVTHAPALTDFDRDPLSCIETGDWVKVDADRGVVEIRKKEAP